MRPVGTSVLAFDICPTWASSAMVIVSANSPVSAPSVGAGSSEPGAASDSVAVSEVPCWPHAARMSAPEKRNASAFHLVRVINSLQWMGWGTVHGPSTTRNNRRPARPAVDYICLSTSLRVQSSRGTLADVRARPRRRRMPVWKADSTFRHYAFVQYIALSGTKGSIGGVRNPGRREDAPAVGRERHIDGHAERAAGDCRIDRLA